MGYLPEATPEMGEYSVEVRGESFYLFGEDNYVLNDPVACKGFCDVIGEHMHSGGGKYEKKRHTFTVYPHGETGQGTVEVLIEDIPKIRAALDQVERIKSGGSDQ